MVEHLTSIKIEDLFNKYSYASDLFSATGLSVTNNALTLGEFIPTIEDEVLQDIGLDKDKINSSFNSLMDRMEQLKIQSNNKVESITIIGGKNKSGDPEAIELELKVGEVISVVGPTGSGKSRLLADIECLAQRDTPTNRQILVNRKVSDRNERFSIENKLVAQLSQNMNFVMDLSVEEFIKLHADSRMIKDADKVVEEIIICANDLAGEKFLPSTPLTQLSGGQSRALMIADTALLSTSPIVLIDEIENAGIDRRKAIGLLVKKEKLVLLSTHDPVLALVGDKRIVIKNGGIEKIIISSDSEKQFIDVLENIDKNMLNIRNHIRAGGIVDSTIVGCLQP